MVSANLFRYRYQLSTDITLVTKIQSRDGSATKVAWHQRKLQRAATAAGLICVAAVCLVILLVCVNTKLCTRKQARM